MGADKFILSCKTGVIKEIVDFGFTTKFENKDQCLTNATGTCTGSYNSTKLYRDITLKCLD